MQVRLPTTHCLWWTRTSRFFRTAWDLQRACTAPCWGACLSSPGLRRGHCSRSAVCMPHPLPGETVSSISANFRWAPWRVFSLKRHVCIIHFKCKGAVGSAVDGRACLKCSPSEWDSFGLFIACFCSKQSWASLTAKCGVYILLATDLPNVEAGDFCFVQSTFKN